MKHLRTTTLVLALALAANGVHKENRIRGFQIGYNYNSNTQNYQSVAGETKRTSNTFNVGYVSQYLLPFGKKFYGTATILSQFEKEQYENNNNFATQWRKLWLSVGIQPGACVSAQQTLDSRCNL
jgi:hypothetical protein